MSKKEQAEKNIKETKYCSILAQAKVFDGKYTYCIEKVFVKKQQQEEIRFCLYKDTINQVERYIPRSLDVTEEEFLELFKEAMTQGVFSKELLTNLRMELAKKRSPVVKKEKPKEVEEEAPEVEEGGEEKDEEGQG